MSDQDSCSVHGLCFDNGMAGRCNEDCELFLLGRCDVGNEIVEGMYDKMTSEEVKVEIECLYEHDEVTLFLLRGENKSDLDLMINGYGYK